MNKIKTLFFTTFCIIFCATSALSNAGYHRCILENLQDQSNKDVLRQVERSCMALHPFSETEKAKLLSEKLMPLRRKYPEFDEYGYTDCEILVYWGERFNQSLRGLVSHYIYDPDFCTGKVTN